MFPLCYPTAQQVTADLPCSRIGGSTRPGCFQVVSDFSEGGQDSCWDVALSAGAVFGMSSLGMPGYIWSLSGGHV